MTLENTLRTSLAEQATAGRHAVTLDHAGWSVALSVERGDALSGLLWQIELRRDTPLPGDVRAWADRVARKVSGLLESLKVIEIDLGQKQALLRSDTPTPRDAAVQYYEVRLHGTSAAQVRRLQGHPHTGDKSVQVAFALTYETLAKLIDDVTAEK